MVTSNIQAVIPCEIRRVWAVVTVVDGYAWRSDLSRTEVLSETQFVEYTKSGYATRFTITGVEPLRRWEFELENTNLRGRWIGIFAPAGAGTALDLTEYVTVKKPLLRSFVKRYLKKQQAQFVADLKQALAPPP